MTTVHETSYQTQHCQEHTPADAADAVDDARIQALLDRAENCEWSRYRRELLGPKLVQVEERLMRRLFRYRDELERLREGAPESWSPRVRFSFEVEAASYALHECGNPACAAPLWPQDNLISVINRRDDAIATAEAKLQLVDLHLSKIQNAFWERRREIERETERLKHGITILRQVMAPQRRRRGRAWR